MRPHRGMPPVWPFAHLPGWSETVRRMSARGAVWAAIALALMLAPVSAFCATMPNRSCFECHAPDGGRYALPQSKPMTITAGPVDYATACRQCHWVGPYDSDTPTVSHPYRNVTTSWHSYAGSTCNNGSPGCHLAPFGRINGMAVPKVYDEAVGGYFNSAASLQADSELLHRIHGNARWQANTDVLAGQPVPGQWDETALFDLRCPSCHAAASCEACHAALNPQHSLHTSATAPTTVARGTPEGNQGVLNVGNINCVTSGCHDLGGVTDTATFENGTASVITSGTWTRVTGIVYSGDSSAIYSYTSGGSVSVVTTGTEFSVYGYRHNQGGKGYVKIDGFTVGTIDFYAAAPTGPGELFRRHLDPGTHTISLVNSGLVGPGGNRMITFDCLKVYRRPYAVLTQPGCTGCHTRHLDEFRVPAVDRAVACKKCHWEPSASHPFHGVSWNCGTCHPGMGGVLPSALPRYDSPTGEGTFNSPSSLGMYFRDLHRIHSEERWPGGVFKNGRRCGSCHRPAACEACHEGGVDPRHADHTWDARTPGYWPGTGPEDRPFGLGTTPGNEGEDNTLPSLTCANAQCHPIGQPEATLLVEDTSASVTFAPVASWGRASQVGYSGNTYRVSNAPGATAEYRFTGQRVQVISDRGPYRGKMRVSVNGGLAAVVDLYAPTTEKMYVAYESGIVPVAEWTVRVEVLPEKNEASRGYYVAVDAFRVTEQVRWPTVECASCH